MSTNIIPSTREIRIAFRRSAGTVGFVRDRSLENVVSVLRRHEHVLPVVDVSIFAVMLQLLISYYQQRK
jgi:hypothetical protein